MSPRQAETAESGAQTPPPGCMSAAGRSRSAISKQDRLSSRELNDDSLACTIALDHVQSCSHASPDRRQVDAGTPSPQLITHARRFDHAMPSHPPAVHALACGVRDQASVPPGSILLNDVHDNVELNQNTSNITSDVLHGESSKRLAPPRNTTPAMCQAGIGCAHACSPSPVPYALQVMCWI